MEETKASAEQNDFGDDFFFVKTSPEEELAKKKQILESVIDRPAPKFVQSSEHSKNALNNSKLIEQCSPPTAELQPFAMARMPMTANNRFAHETSSDMMQNSQFSFPDINDNSCSPKAEPVKRPSTTQNKNATEQKIITSPNISINEPEAKQNYTVMSQEGSAKKGKRNAFLAVDEQPDDEDLFISPNVVRDRSETQSNDIRPTNQFIEFYEENKSTGHLPQKKKIATRLIGKQYGDLEDLSRIHTLQVDGGAVWVIKFRKDGKFFATGGNDGILRVW